MRERGPRTGESTREWVKHTGLGTGGDAPFEMVSAGDHCAFRMSKQIDPLLFTFGWYMRVVKETFGGLNG